MMLFFSNFRLKNIGFILIHAGLIIAFFAGLLGNSNLQRLRMLVFVNGTEQRAMNHQNELVELPFAIELKSFTIDEYPNHVPKCFASNVTVYTQNGITKDAVIEVNKPLSMVGWKIYQSGYEKALGKWSRYSIFELVKDPWLPAIYTGFFIRLAGALFMFFSAPIRINETGLIIFIKWKYKWIVSMGTLLLFLIISIILFHPEIFFKNLMPALQSPWFVPHVIAYILAYTALGVAAILTIFLLIRRKKQTQFIVICDNLVYVGIAFLTFGTLFGAFWAKEAWGHYWSWDPKEAWAAATWLAFLLYIHFRLHQPAKTKTALWLLLFAFVILLICWYGVNYLPSVQGNSMHVYSFNASNQP
jgi:ABC-type transport system involved in cytochrome c biogenesis permease subunit